MKNGVLLVLVFFFTAFFSCGLALLVLFIIFFMFAASKIDSGANRVNVRNLFKIIENVFIYLFIYYVFVKLVIFFVRTSRIQGENSVCDTSEQSSFSRKN